MKNINGYIEIDGVISKVISLDDLKQIVQSLGKDFIDDVEYCVDDDEDCIDDDNVDDDEPGVWDDYGQSGEEYGWYNGYSDDVIDDAFDGDPEATWNVD